MNNLKINEFYFIEYHQFNMIQQIYIVIILNKYEAKVVKILAKFRAANLNETISIKHYLPNFTFIKLTKLDKLKHL